MAVDAVDLTTPTSFIEHPRETMNDVIERHAGEEGVHVFYACGMNVQLIRESEGDQVFNHQGLPVGRPHPGLRYSFAPTGAIAVREGQDVRPDGPNGEDQDAVQWLLRHPNLNMFFWEAGNEPDRQRPLESDYLKAVHAALSNGEEVKLVALLEEEKAGHNRQVLVEAANSALDVLRESRRQQEQTLRYTQGSTELRDPAVPAEPFDRAAALETLTARGVELTVEATDEQLQAVLLVTAPTSPPGPADGDGAAAPAETPTTPKRAASRPKPHGRARGR